MKESMKTEATHTDCNSCEYGSTCFRLLKWSHRLFRNCAQGKKNAVRIKAKDQKTLPEVIDKDLIS